MVLEVCLIHKEQSLRWQLGAEMGMPRARTPSKDIPRILLLVHAWALIQTFVINSRLFHDKCTCKWHS